MNQSYRTLFYAITFWVLLSGVSQPVLARDLAATNPCVSSDPSLGDSAHWAVLAVEQFAALDYQAAVDTVNACFDRWGPAAGHQQKAMHNRNKRCPRTGKVSKRARKKIEANYLINDVSLALWAKARSLDRLGDKRLARDAYGQCVYMSCGRAWDPKGWYWSPAQDCAEQVQPLLNRSP